MIGDRVWNEHYGFGTIDGNTFSMFNAFESMYCIQFDNGLMRWLMRDEFELVEIV